MMGQWLKLPASDAKFMICCWRGFLPGAIDDMAVAA